jgi:hypothetical protein
VTVEKQEALARRALFDQRRRPVPAVDHLLHRWGRTARGERRIDPVEWVSALSEDRCVLHDLGRAGVAHRAVEFLAMLTARLDGLDLDFYRSTDDAKGMACTWLGADPARWWYRRLPRETEYHEYFSPVGEIAGGDIAARNAPFPAREDRANLTTLHRSQLRAGQSLSGADLVAADLSEADLSGRDLTGADLTCADLSGANLSGARLSGADLTMVEAREANFSGAMMQGCRLEAARCQGSSFERANLTGAKLFKAEMFEASLRDAVLRNADITDLNVFDADVHGIDLEGATGVERYRLLRPQT